MSVQIMVASECFQGGCSLIPLLSHTDHSSSFLFYVLSVCERERVNVCVCGLWRFLLQLISENHSGPTHTHTHAVVWYCLGWNTNSHCLVLFQWKKSSGFTHEQIQFKKNLPKETAQYDAENEICNTVALLLPSWLLKTLKKLFFFCLFIKKRTRNSKNTKSLQEKYHFLTLISGIQYGCLLTQITIVPFG